MTRPIYRALTDAPVPSTGWARVRMSSHVARDIILASAWPEFTLSLWVYADSDEVVASVMHVMAFGRANMSTSTYGQLSLYANLPDKSLTVGWYWTGENMRLAAGTGGAFPLDSWCHVAVTHDAALNSSLYVGGVLVQTRAGSAHTGSAPDPAHLSGAFLSTDAVFGTKSGLSNVGIFDRALDADEIAEIAGRGRDHYYSEASGDWAGENPPVEWSGPAVDGQVPNDGTGGACTFGTGYVVDPFWGVGAEHPVVSSEGDAPATQVKRSGSRGRYPPLHQWLATSGASGSRFALLSPVLSRIFFPAGGGWGTGTFGVWVKRPLSPDVAVGTLAQITSGTSSITIGITTGEVPEVTVTDGTHTVSDTLPALTADVPHWIAILSNHLDDELVIFLDGVAVATLDTSTVDPAAVTTGMSFSIGSNVDTSDPLDVFWTGLGGFEVALTTDDIEAIYTGGWKGDLRDPVPLTDWSPPTIENPEGESPVVDYYWRDEIVDGVVPGANTQTPALVPFSASMEIEDSVIRAWFMGDHRIGVHSSAWFSDASRAPELWALAFAADDHSTVFGEVPRIVGVTLRDDGALLLDTDARCVPGIGYQIRGADDLSGDDALSNGYDLTAPMPALLHTAPTVPALLDIDSPVVPAAGFSTMPSGDYKLSGENATVEKIIWATLLTTAGTLDWDPAFGTNLRHKRLRPADLSSERRRIAQQVAGVPYVKRADVQLLFEDDEVVVAVSAETGFGRLETRRAFDAA